MAYILPEDPITDLEAYRSSGGGKALQRAHTLGRDRVIAEIREAGLRGRGGSGFPTAFKWAGLAGDDAKTKFVVANAAEGEPGTFKDRAIIRSNPHQVLEGLAVAAFVTGATQMFLGVKGKFTAEIARIETAARELSGTGLLGEAELVIVEGPDDYLFGEEKGLLEVIEGKDPLPRLHPPYVQGLFEARDGPEQPAVVNNVETLANVAPIIANGADWYRSMGTQESPGTMVCTIGGDVHTEGVAEIELGTPLRDAIDVVGNGLSGDGRIKLVLNGVSNAPIAAEDLDTPLSFEAMRAAGSGLGSAGFTVFDDTVCAVKVATAASGFLYRGSCGQCPPCKLGTAGITEGFLSLALGGSVEDVEDIAGWSMRVTDANRCGLGAGQQALAWGILDRFPEDLAHHIEGDPCPHDRPVAVTTIEDWDESAGRFRYSKPVLQDAPGA